MSEVKQYSYGYHDDGFGGRHLGLIEKARGDLVLHEDYARLERECERLRSALTEISAMQSHECTIGQNLKDAVRVACDALGAKP